MTGVRRQALGGVARRLAWPFSVALALLPATFVLPAIDATRPPSVDLTSGLATFFLWAAHSGNVVGVTIISSVTLALLVTREGISGRRRAREASLVAIVLMVCAGGSSAFNEDVVKVAFRKPRPNIVYLAGVDGRGPLGMSPEAFYGQGDRQARSALLRQVLEAEPAAVPMSPAVREHWIASTGYSFPSGHALSAMLVATFYLAMGVTYTSRPRRWLFYLLLPWAVVVCCSRPILGVHTPADITAGGLEGFVLGLAAFLFVRARLGGWTTIR